MKDPNKNRKGYKNSKVGWIPEEWECVLIDKVAKRATGHTPNKNHPEYWNGGIKWVSLSDSHRLDLPTITSTEKKISRQGIENSSARLLPAGTVIMLRDAAVGKVSILKTEMAVSQHFVTWTCAEQANGLFLYYYLLSQRKLFERQAVGTTIVTIGMSFFSQLSYPFPPLPEQGKIATILSTWDRALAALDELLDAKQRQKQALMQQLLSGQTRLPGCKGKWVTKKMSDIFQRMTRKNNHNCQNTLTISGKHGLVNQEGYFSKRIASKDVTRYYLLKRGEFAYNKSTSSGHPYGAIKRLVRYDEGVVSTLYICFRAIDSKEILEFYEHFFEGGMLNQGLYGIVQEGARSHGLLNISVSDFMELSMHVPLPEEQQKIATILTAADRELSALTAKREALHTQKKALMQQLLTGQIRVNT